MWRQKSKERRREEKETMVTEFGPWNTEEMGFKAEMEEKQSKNPGSYLSSCRAIKCGK